MRRRLPPPFALNWESELSQHGAASRVAGAEPVQAVGAAVDEAARRGEVVLCQGLTDGRLLVCQKDGEELGRHVQLTGEVRVVDEVAAGALSVPSVVGPAGELDE